MAAVRPIVLVHQDIANVSVPVSLPDLNITIVGPAFRIYDYATDKSSIYAGVDVGTLTTLPNGNAAATYVALAATNIPNWTTGDVLADTSGANAPVLYLDTGYVELCYGQDGTVTANQNTLGSSGTNFVTSGVQAGDRVIVSDLDNSAGVVTVAKTVQAVTASTLTLSTNFATGGTDITGAPFVGITLATAGLKFRVERLVTGVKCNETVTCNATVTPPTVAFANLTANVGGVAKRVVYGKPYVQYRALRTDLANDLSQVYTTQDVKGQLGKIDERNPLAVACFVALQNCGSSSLSKKVTYFGVTTDDQVGHQDAIDKLKGRRDIYCVVPLTGLQTIIKIWRDSCVALADPAIAKFRVVVANYDLPASKSVYAPAGTPGTVEAGAGTFTLLDNTATFITTGVQVGDSLTVNATTYPVLAVNSENRITLTGTSGGLASQAYSISRTFTAATALTELTSVATSLKSSRCVLVWPDECLVSGVNNAATGSQNHQPGMYVAAAVGGMVAGLPPQQGFTYIGMAGITQVFRSNTYFRDDQIDSLSNAGYYVVVQDTPSALPYCIHELTTDTSTLESGELMVVKNFDYISMAYRDAFVGFLGQYNVIPSTLALLRASFDAVTETLRLRRYPKIGPSVLGATITSIAPTDSKDQVDIYAEVTMPRPLNRVGLHLTA